MNDNETWGQHTLETPVNVREDFTLTSINFGHLHDYKNWEMLGIRVYNNIKIGIINITWSKFYKSDNKGNFGKPVVLKKGQRYLIEFKLKQHAKHMQILD